MIIGLFGGTFNPVHYGHLRAAEEAVSILGLDKVLFIPAGVPPLKNSGIVSVDHRVKMVELATAGNPHFEVSAIEAAGNGKSYTVDTIETLRRQYPDDEFVFIMGVDSFIDIHLWKEPRKLLGLCDFLVLGRPQYDFVNLKGMPFHDISAKQLWELDLHGYGTVEGKLEGGRKITLYAMPPLWVSSTDMREMFREGRSVRYLLPESVESYIMSHGLYKG